MPKTLEEAVALITTLQTQVATLSADKDKILAEKKQVMEFSEQEKENMTENEKKLLAVIEAERKSRQDIEDGIKKDTEARNKAENEKVSKSIEERIVRISKGDKAVEDKLRANVALLEKMPRSTDSEIDALATAGYNMLGTNKPNPLNETNGINGGAPNVGEKPTFGETTQGKAVADKLGFDFAKPADAQ